MKHIPFLLSFLTLSIFASAQTYGGLSVGYFHYRTNWYFHSSSGNPAHDIYPAHSLNRFVITANLEKKGAWKSQSFRFDAGGELLLAPAGKAKGIWLPGDDVISSSGWGIGVNAYGRAVYIPPTSSQSVKFFPFISLGPHYMFLHNSGKGAGTYAKEYNYQDGWNEGITLIASSIGVDLAFDDFVLTPEFRFGLFGWNSSSWEPHGADVTMDGGPGFTAFSVRLSKKF